MTDTIATSTTVPTGPEARPLSFFESFFTMHAATVWITSRVTGPVDFEVLRDAWGLLRQAHPVLTGRLSPGAQELMPGVPSVELAFPPDPEPARISVREHAARDSGPRSLGFGDPLALVEVADQGDKTLVAFVVHHAIADGRLAFHWNRELWSYYTGLIEGEAFLPEPHPVPLSPEALLAEHGIAKTELGASRAEHATPSELPEGEPGKTGPWRRIHLSESDTARLRAYAKRNGQTMHGLVVGAVSVATRRFLPSADGRAIDIGVNSPVDIRGRLEPAVPVWGGTNVLGHADAVVSVRPDSDPVEVGAEVLRQLAEDLASGVLQQSFLHLADSFGKPMPKVPQVMTTNVGVLEPIPTPHGVVIDEVRGALATDWAPIVALMEDAGQSADNPLLLSPLHIILTHAGRLSIDFSTPMPPGRELAYAETLESLLTDIAARG